MYPQPFSSSTYSSSFNFNTSLTPATVDPMYQEIPQAYDQGYPYPAQQSDFGLMGYQNNMIPNQPFAPDGMMQVNNGAHFHDQQFHNMDQQAPISYQMMHQQQMMGAGTLQNYQPGFQQDFFQPLPQMIPINEHNFRYMGNTQDAPELYHGFENIPPAAPTDPFKFISAQSSDLPPFDNFNVPTAPARKRKSPKSEKKNKIPVVKVCSNCGTDKTTMWRTSRKGERECNACNLYEDVNGEKRPEHLWNKPTIKRKRRTPAVPVEHD